MYKYLPTYNSRTDMKNDTSAVDEEDILRNLHRKLSKISAAQAAVVDAAAAYLHCTRDTHTIVESTCEFCTRQSLCIRPVKNTSTLLNLLNP